MRNSEGYVKAAFSGVRRNANVTEDECRSALNIFMAPDPESSSKNDDGRRIKEVEGGWFIINHEKYQYSSEEKRNYWREKKAAERARKALLGDSKNRKRSLPEPGASFVARGADSGATADAVNAELEANRKEAAERDGEYDPRI